MMRGVVVFLGCLFLFASCEEILNEIDISDEKVVLLAPADNVTLKADNAISFTWQSIEDADEYQLQVALPSFEKATAIVLDTTVVEATLSIGTLNESVYEWRVRAKNSGYKTNYSSNSFTVENTAKKTK